MGAPPANNPSMTFRTSPTTQLAAQHERLILELLPFNEAAKFQEWLRSDFVYGAWTEFARDFLANPSIMEKAANEPEPDKNKTAQATKDAISARQHKFLLYHPDKIGYTVQDHHIRFMVMVIQDNMLKSLWSDWDWKKKGLDIAKAIYEVLFYLKATASTADQNPPGYSQ